MNHADCIICGGIAGRSAALYIAACGTPQVRALILRPAARRF